MQTSHNSQPEPPYLFYPDILEAKTNKGFDLLSRLELLEIVESVGDSYIKYYRLSVSDFSQLLENTTIEDIALARNKVSSILSDTDYPKTGVILETLKHVLERCNQLLN